MTAFDQLAILAQIAATYAGFIAVFVALGNEGRFSPSDAHFVRVLVAGTVIVIACSLGPIVSHDLLDLAEFWCVGDGVAAGFGLLVIGWVAWEQRAMPRDAAREIGVGWHAPGWAFGATATLLFVAGAIGLLPGAAAYVAATTCILMASIWCFVAVVFRRFF